MKEDWISSSMTTSSMRSNSVAIYGLILPRPSGVDERFLGVRLDERAASLDVLAHQDAEHAIGRRGVLEGDPLQDARLRVHGGLPQLLGVHLAEPLEPADLDPLVPVLRPHPLELLLVEDVRSE